MKTRTLDRTIRANGRIERVTHIRYDDAYMKTMKKKKRNKRGAGQRSERR